MGLTKKEAIEYMSKFFSEEPVVLHDYFYERLLDYITDSDLGPQLLVPCNKKGRYEWEQENSAHLETASTSSENLQND